MHYTACIKAPVIGTMTQALESVMRILKRIISQRRLMQYLLSLMRETRQADSRGVFFLYEDRLIVGGVNHARPIEKERNE